MSLVVVVVVADAGGGAVCDAVAAAAADAAVEGGVVGHIPRYWFADNHDGDGRRSYDGAHPRSL